MLKIILVSVLILLASFTGVYAGVHKKVIRVRATAYCLRGHTATGIHAQHGIIAVDPKVIPLGSVVHVEGYGRAIAADTGGKIKGNRIDIHLPSRGACYRWGRRSVKVTIISTPKAKAKVHHTHKKNMKIKKYRKLSRKQRKTT